uniref:hypothetical protein n=1 Tax=Sphingomonas populi TaxID=2484750 RepID=UPI0019D10317
IAIVKFLSLKELHRLPPPPQGQTSAQARYLTANTTAAQRLRAVGREPPIDREGGENGENWRRAADPLPSGGHQLMRLGCYGHPA